MAIALACTMLVCEVSSQAATLSPDAVTAGFTLTMTATGFPTGGFEQLAGVVAFTDSQNQNKIMVDGIPSGNIYLLDDVDNQTPSGATFQPVSVAPTNGAQSMVYQNGMIYLADAENTRILQINTDGTVNPLPLVDMLPMRPTALAINARNNHVLISGGNMVLDVDPVNPNPYTVLIPDWGTGGVAFSEDYTTLFVEGGQYATPIIRRYVIDGTNATRDLEHADVPASEQLYGLIVGTGCLSPSLFMSAQSGFVQVMTSASMKNVINSNGAGFITRDEKDGCLLFTSEQLYRLCPPACGGFVGITPAPINACATNNGGCGPHSDCSPTITGAPQCTCTTGWIAVSANSNNCIQVKLAGVWVDTTLPNVFITVTQTGTSLQATTSGATSDWSSATGVVGAAGSLTFEFNNAPGVSVHAVVFDSTQRQIDFDGSSTHTWVRRSVVGEGCTVNSDCTSNNCVNGVCKQSSVDIPCATNADCTSNNCVNGVCKPNGPGGKCGQQSDCEANVLCTYGKCSGVNACYTLNGGCHWDAVCVPTGSTKRKCSCNQGYHGNGVGAKGCLGPCRGNPAARHGGTIDCTGPYVSDSTTCKLVCPVGFYARGYFKCEDGHWHDHDPVCSAASCAAPDLSAIAHAVPGSCVGKKTYHECTLGCAAGFLPAGNTHAICLGSTGSGAEYSFSTFSCHDVDECRYLPLACGAGWQCTNTEGGHLCIPLAPVLERKGAKEVELKWTRLGDHPKIHHLSVQFNDVTGHKKTHKIENPEWADKVHIKDLVPGATYTFTLVASTPQGLANGLPLTVTL